MTIIMFIVMNISAITKMSSMYCDFVIIAFEKSVDLSIKFFKMYVSIIVDVLRIAANVNTINRESLYFETMLHTSNRLNLISIFCFFCLFHSLLCPDRICLAAVIVFFRPLNSIKIQAGLSRIFLLLTTKN